MTPGVPTSRFDGIDRWCHRCGEWVKAEEAHEDACAARDQARANREGIERVRRALERAKENQ